MSYQESFVALINSNAGEPFTKGAFALMRFSNHQDLLERRIPGDHDAHVLLNEDRLTSEAAARVLTNYCPPPVVNDKAATVTAPAASGQGVGSLKSSSRTNTHLNPAGVSGCDDLAHSLALISSPLSRPNTSIPARISPIAARAEIPQKVTALTCMVVLPVVPGIISRKSNLDLNGRLVKKGALVSWHGFRGRIVKVRMGTAYPERGSPLRINVGAFVSCESLQVVR